LAEKHCTLPLCLILAEETSHGFSFLPDRCFYIPRSAPGGQIATRW